MFKISPSVKILFIAKLHAILTQEVKFELRKTTKKAIFKGLNYTGQETADRRLEPEDGRQETDKRETGWRQETDMQETGGRQDMGDRQAGDRRNTVYGKQTGERRTVDKQETGDRQETETGKRQAGEGRQAGD